MVSDQYEESLLQDAQSGDEDAYTELQELLEPAIWRFVNRLIGNPDLADDITQDVFISFYRNIHRIDPVSNLRPYIFRIARNRCYDALRRNGRTEIVSLDDEPIRTRILYAQASAEPQPDDVTHWLLLHLEVREAMEKLPESQRQALILFAEENLTYTEIAEIMDVSVGTVKSRVYYAKKNLRGYLRPEILSALESELVSEPKKKKSESEKSVMEEEAYERVPEPGY